MLSGGIIVTIGVVLLLRQLGFYFPVWLFSWPVWLIIIGLIVGVSSSYDYRKDISWLILVGIGGVFLFNRMYPGLQLTRFLWPGIIIGFGLWLVFGTRRWWQTNQWNSGQGWSQYAGNPYTEFTSMDEVLDDVSVFGSIKKNVPAKNFRGGEIVTVFGSAELNLTHADIQGRVELEIVQAFGNTKLIIPSSWEVVSKEMVAVFGNINAKRPPAPLAHSNEKVLVLKGVSAFANVEVLSYA
jgi:predicted membrane protein